MSKNEASALLPTEKVLDILTAELDEMVGAKLANPYHGLIRSRQEGRASGIALAIGLLTGVDSDTVLEDSEVRWAERAGRDEDARELVRDKRTGEFVWRRPWCDCDHPRPFTRLTDGTGRWVRSCCKRPTKHAWLKHGNALGPTLPEVKR